VFLVNLPVGAGVILLGRSLVPEGRAELGHRHFDLSGALLVTAGFVALVFGIVRTAAFVIVEGRLAAAPLVPLRIFSRAKLRAANIVVLALYSAVFAMWF